MLKKLLAVLMCITMATSFVACGEDDEKDSKKNKRDSKEISSEIDEEDEENEEEEETEDPEKAAEEIAEAEKAVAELEEEVDSKHYAIDEAPAEVDDEFGISADVDSKLSDEEIDEVVDSIMDEADVELDSKQEEFAEGIAEEAIENQLELSENIPSENNDTLGLADILTSGDWYSSTIAVSGMSEMAIEDFCALGGVDTAEMEMSMSFSADGSVTLTSSTAVEPGSYVIDAENIYIVDTTDTAAVSLAYDEATGMILLDLLGDGSMIMGFEQ